MNLFEKGIGRITLTQSHYKASGGEGDIYVANGKVYKIYQDKTKVILEAKISELSAISEKYIIKPEHLLLDSNNTPVGYSMNLVPESYALCQLFPKTFKNRNNISNDQICKLILKLRNGIEHVHSKNILIVDVNELNFLVDKHFKDIYFIDVDSYKTKSFNPTAIMDSVRDRHSKDFTIMTDWFSFGVLAFNLLTGIHPFRGTYQPFSHIKDLGDMLNTRMLNSISVLHSGVKVPPVVNLDVIPKVYKDWFYAIFEDGKRMPPPKDLIQAVHVIAATTLKASEKFIVEKYLSFADRISWKKGDFTYTNKLEYKGKSFHLPLDCAVGLTPKLNRPLAAYTEDGKLQILNLELNRHVNLNIDAQAVISYQNRFYIKSYDKVLELSFFEGNELLVSTKTLCTVMPQATTLFSGCVIQNVVGKCYVTLLDKSGINRQVQLKELDGLIIFDAVYDKNVMVVSANDKSVSKHFIFTFAESNTYSVRTVVTTDAINFTALDNGICLYQNGDTLEIFSAKSTSVKVVEDNFLTQDYMLSHEGTQALAIVDKEVLKIRLKS